VDSLPRSSSLPPADRSPVPLPLALQLTPAARPIWHRRSAVAIVGIVGAVVGAVFVSVLHLLTELLGPGHRPAAWHVIVMVGIGVVVSLLYRWVGTPHDVELLVDNIHLDGRGGALKDLKSLLPVSLLCIAAGGALGPEAPLVQTTGALGTRIAQRWKLHPEQVRVLTIVGMAAGFTVLFGVPLGAAIFALEILHPRGLQYYEALLPAIAGSLFGWVTSLALRGIAIGAGVVGAGIAFGFVLLVRFAQRAAGRLPRAALPPLAGLLLGLLGWWSPYALTFGEYQIDPMLGAGLGVTAALVAGGAKLVGSVVTLAGQWRGGFIIPLFFVGAAVGQAVTSAVPMAPAGVVVAGLMVATNVGVTKTLIGSTLVVIGMGGLHLVPTTLLAGGVAMLLAGRVQLFETQRERLAPPPAPMVARP
jgi:H+/Cl- antiporter ClcA